MSKRLILSLGIFVAIVILSCGLVGCGMFPVGNCVHHYEVVESTETCHEDGVRTEKCTKCGYELKTPVKGGHVYVIVEDKPATCFEDGCVVKECTRCGWISREYTTKSHKYVVIENTATCTEDGVEINECSVCGDRAEFPRTALGHATISIGKAVEPTCTSVGYTAGVKCGRCGVVLEERVELPKAHKPDADEKCVFCGAILKKYNVTFDLQDGNNPVTQEYVHGSTLNYPTAPEKPNSVFIGWYVGEQKCDENYTVSATVTVVAKYAPIISIRDADGLKAIADAPDGFYRLENDINMRGDALPMLDEFSGTLDGKGYAVYDAMLNFSANATYENYGFIRVNKGTIKNITFSDLVFIAESKDDNRRTVNVGVIAGVNQGVIQGVTLRSGRITMNFDNHPDSRAYLECKAYFGGIVGLNDADATISDCINNLSLESQMNFGNYNSSGFYMGTGRDLLGGVGGIAGVNNGSISGSDYNGSISVSSYARNVTSGGGGYEELSNISACIGGIVGWMGENGSVTECYANGEFSLTTRIGKYAHIYGYVGGLVGVNYGNVTDSFAQGSSAGDTFDLVNVGGLVGVNHSTGKVSACHATVDVLAKTLSNSATGCVGGVVGKNSASIQKCYATGDVTAVNKVSAGGFVGCNLSGGMVRNSYSTGNVNASCEENMSLGDCGYFVGTSEMSSILYKCRYFSGAIVMRGGQYLEQSAESGNNVAQSITAQQLWTESFLADEFNWDTEDGWIVFNEDNPILAWELERGHNFESKVIAPTHEYGGYTAYHCADCGRLYISDYTDPLGHTYENVRTVAPTCTEQGYDVVRCTKDGCDFDGEVRINYTSAKGHVKGEHDEPISITTAATCGAEGLGEYRCGVCGQNFTAQIPATENHVWVDVEEKAVIACASGTRGEEGYSAYRYCSVCGLIDGKVVATPHTDVNFDNVCDVCHGLTFTTVSRSEFVEISDAAGLAAISNNLCKNYILTNDVNLTGVAWKAIGTKTAPFTGILYGNGHSIIGLTGDVDSASGVTAAGLFAYNSGKIIGVTLNGFALNAQNSDVVFGGFAAYNYGEIIDCVILGDNALQYFSEKKIVSGDNDSGCGVAYMLTAGGFAGVNGARGRVVDCTVEGRIVSKNAVYGQIMLNVGSTIWTAAGSVLNNIIFDTRLEVSQTVTFGGVVGMNSGEVSDCNVTGEVNVYSIAQANLVQLKGKLNVTTELYAGSLIGSNAGVVAGNSATAISYDIPSEYKSIAVPYIVTGNAYKLTYEIVNHGADGDGRIGVDTTAKRN